jgi:hypothetical protein
MVFWWSNGKKEGRVDRIIAPDLCWLTLSLFVLATYVLQACSCSEASAAAHSSWARGSYDHISLVASTPLRAVLSHIRRTRFWTMLMVKHISECCRPFVLPRLVLRSPSSKFTTLPSSWSICVFIILPIPHRCVFLETRLQSPSQNSRDTHGTVAFASVAFYADEQVFSEPSTIPVTVLSPQFG